MEEKSIKVADFFFLRNGEKRALEEENWEKWRYTYKTQKTKREVEGRRDNDS